MITEFGKQLENKTQLEENVIIGNPSFLDESAIHFKGKGNILIAEDDVRLSESTITFCGDDAVVFLSHNKKHIYKLKLDAWRETAVYFGPENYFNGPLFAIVSERQNLFIGREGVFSFGVWIRTADPHLIYDIDSKKRINKSKSVLVGDHVWLGQNAVLLKGTEIGSGSIVSANCVLAGKSVESNTVYAGNPGKCIKSKVFFSSKSVHNYKKSQTKQSMSLATNEWIFTKDETTLQVKDLFKKLTSFQSAEERLELIKKVADTANQKNRFFIEKRNSSFLKRMKLR